MATLEPDEIKTLEQIRQRLQTLNSSLTALQANFYDVLPLPTWCASMISLTARPRVMSLI